MIKKVSASKLEAYVSCPYRYYIKYVKELGKRGVSTDSMHYGTMIHEILKDFHIWAKNNSLPEDPTEMKKVIYYKAMDIITMNLDKYRDSIGRPASPHSIYRDHISVYLDNFFMPNRIYNRHFDGEKEFSIPIRDVAATIEPSKLSPLVEKYGHVLLNGKIDLVVYPDIVVDFKTQGKKSFEKAYMANFQTILYTLIHPLDMSFIYMFLWKNYETKELRLSSESRADNLNMVVNLIDRIETAVHYNKDQKSCKRCIFKHLCPTVS